MFVPAVDVAKCELVFLQHTQRVENVYHVLSGTGTVLAADLDRIQAKLLAWVNANRNVFSSSTTLILMSLADQTVNNGIAKDYTISPAIAGTGTGTLLPGNVTIAIKWSTAFRGRSFRGRTYAVGLTANMVSGNQLTSANVTAFQTSYNNLITQLAAGGTVDKLVIVSRRSNNEWRETATITDVTGCSVEANLDSQRRRLTGPGRGD